MLTLFHVLPDAISGNPLETAHHRTHRATGFYLHRNEIELKELSTKCKAKQIQLRGTS